MDHAATEVLRQPGRGAHLVQLYTREKTLLAAAADFAAGGLHAGEAVIVISSLARWESLQRALEQRGHDVLHLALHGRLRFSGMRHSIVSEGHGDIAAALDAHLGNMMRHALIRHRAVRVFNDMADFLRSRRKAAAAERLEQSLQGFVANQPVALLCARRAESLEPDFYGEALQSACTCHTHVLPDHDWQWLEEAVSHTLAEVLDLDLARQASTLATAHRRAVEMPLAYQTMLWLQQQMPRTAGKVLAQLRAKKGSGPFF